jgi:hypothetical protein
MKLKNYQSEATAFIQDFLQKHPEVVEKQKLHRATWWDRPQSLQERAKTEEATVAQQSYVYYNNP